MEQLSGMSFHQWRIVVHCDGNGKRNKVGIVLTSSLYPNNNLFEVYWLGVEELETSVIIFHSNAWNCEVLGGGAGLFGNRPVVVRLTRKANDPDSVQDSRKPDEDVNCYTIEQRRRCELLYY